MAAKTMYAMKRELTFVELVWNLSAGQTRETCVKNLVDLNQLNQTLIGHQVCQCGFKIGDTMDILTFKI